MVGEGEGAPAEDCLASGGVRSRGGFHVGRRTSQVPRNLPHALRSPLGNTFGAIRVRQGSHAREPENDFVYLDFVYLFNRTAGSVSTIRTVHC